MLTYSESKSETKSETAAASRKPPTPLLMPRRESQVAVNQSTPPAPPHQTTHRGTERRSAPDPAPEVPTELSRWLSGDAGLDAEAVSKLWADCKRIDPKATADEVIAAFKATHPRWSSPTVKNRIGMVLTIVPLEFMGGGRESVANHRRAKAAEECVSLA